MEMVQLYDTDARKIVQIPANELAPGSVCVEIEGVGSNVWVSADDMNLVGGELRHPPFKKEIRRYIRKIQAAFREVYPMSFKEWEDGFRRDTNPAQEIACWLYAAEVYGQFARREPSLRKRADTFRCISACMVSPHDHIRQVYSPEVLSTEETEAIVNRFYHRTPS